MDFQFADILECLCDAQPEGEVLAAGDEVRTRLQLDARANRLAHHLQAHGIQRGDHVGIYAYNRIEFVEALLACWKLGAAPINVNWRYVVDELRSIWRGADMKALIYERGFAVRVATLAPEFPSIETYVVIDDSSDTTNDPLGAEYETALGARPDTRNFPPRSGDDLHLVYTGGTTGMPKGVLWRHEDWYLNVAHPLAPRVEKPEDIATLVDNPLRMRTLTLSPLMHGGGQFPLMLTLFNGGVGLFPITRHFDADEVLKMVERHRASTISIIGDAMGRPLAEARLTSARDVDCSSLVAISTGGALLTEPVRIRLREAFGEIFITGGIGSSEIGSAARETRGEAMSDSVHFRLEENVAVLDDALRPIPPGAATIGRIARKGHIPLGYYKDERKTQETFVTDAEGTRWVIPGDFARVAEDGSFVLLGRGSSCINTGGEKVFPDEVENVIVGHPKVRGAAVVGIEDPRWMQRIVALVELEDQDDQLELASLQEHCRRHLAGYKIPRALVTTELVRTPAGKVDHAWAIACAETHAGAETTRSGD